MKSTEYEKKYKITEKQKQGLITHLGDPDSISHQVDRYYDSRDANLFRRGIFMRIRRDKFQIKFNLRDVLSGQSSGHTQCTENEWQLHLSGIEQVELKTTLDLLDIKYPDNIVTPFALFDDRGWVESIVIDKRRSVYQFHNYTISLDVVEELGIFAEVESSIEAPTPSAEERRLFSIIEEEKWQYVDTGYNALWWRKYNWDIYVQSPYMMARDKNA